jgi:uncharacterized RDD family membrane protein YckC
LWAWSYLPQQAAWAQWLESVAGALLLGALAVVAFAYHFLFEWLWDGQTPGKRWLGMRVLHTDGMPAGTWAIMVRNMLRFVDFLPASYGLGAFVALVNPHNRRIGDLVAGTVVARQKHDSSRKHVLDINEAADAFLTSYAQMRQGQAAPAADSTANAASSTLLLPTHN